MSKFLRHFVQGVIALGVLGVIVSVAAGDVLASVIFAVATTVIGFVYLYAEENV